jgi:hypothetical protein
LEQHVPRKLPFYSTLHGRKCASGTSRRKHPIDYLLDTVKPHNQRVISTHLSNRTWARKKNLKRIRDRLCTQEFFALPPDDDGPSLPLPAKSLGHCICPDSHFTAAARDVANDIARFEPGRLAQGKSGDWAKVEGIHRTAAAEYQEDFKNTYHERLERERRGMSWRI